VKVYWVYTSPIEVYFWGAFAAASGSLAYILYKRRKK